MPKINKTKQKTKKNKGIGKIYRTKKNGRSVSLKKNKRGGFPSWSNISNLGSDLSNWSSTLKDKFNNFSIFKKKNQQPSVNNSYNEEIVSRQQSDQPVEQSQYQLLQDQLLQDQLQQDQLQQDQLQQDQLQQNQMPLIESLSIPKQKTDEQIGGAGHHYMNNLLENSSHFLQPTAKPQVFVGGKTKYKKNKNNHKYKKTHKKSYL